MKSFPTFSSVPSLKLTALGALSLFCLSACDDKEETAEPAPKTEEAAAPAPAPAPTEAPAVAEEQVSAPASPDAKAVLFDEMLNGLFGKVTDPAVFPELNEEVKVILEQLENYYDVMAKEPEASIKRTKLALLIASTLRNLNSNRAFDAYTRALGELNALPEAQRNSAEAKNCESNIENGLGSCLLMQNKPAEALPHYETALAVAQAQFDAVAPAEDAEPEEGEVAPELSHAATDLLDSIRCLGDCQRLADDPEEARTTYLKGQELVTKLKVLSAPMSISYIKLLTALGNLDNSAGRSKEALSAWAMGANISKQLNNSSPRLDVKAETKRCYDALIPAIQAVAKALNAASAEQTPTEGNADIQSEPITPELKAAAAGAAKNVPATAPAPAKPAPAKPANKRKRR